MTVMLVRGVVEYNATTNRLKVESMPLGPDMDNASSFSPASMGVMSVINRLTPILLDICRSMHTVSLCESAPGCSLHLALNGDGYALVITTTEGDLPPDLAILVEPLYEIHEKLTSY